jgi:hypothetical protein
VFARIIQQGFKMPPVYASQDDLMARLDMDLVEL